MKLIGQVVAVLFGVSLLAAIGFSVYLGLEYIVALFAGLDPQVASVTGIACVVAFTAVWAVSRSLGRAVRQGKAMALREEKTATYQLFVDYWKSRLQSGVAPTDPSEKLALLDRLLALYGGAPVIRAHAALRDLGLQARHSESRARFGEALVAIRRDLGTDTPGDAARELEQLVLTTPDGTR